MTIRAGVVGLGFMGHRYATVLSRLEGVTVTAVSDTRPDVLERVAVEVGARAAADAGALATADDVDAVFVCTPEPAHEASAIAALESGKHVLIEKPVTHDLASAARVRAAAERAGTVTLVGHLLRFEARWAAAHEAIAAGRIGQVVSIATRRVGNVGDQDVLAGRTSIPLYYGVHDLDIVRWFAGSRATSMQAARRRGVLERHGFDIDDLYCAILTFDDGILATAELGWHVPRAAVSAPSTGITVVGTDGWLRIEQGQTGLQVFAADDAGRAGSAIDVSFWPDVHGRTGGAFHNELTHFLDCIRDGRPPLVGIDDGIEALRLSLAMEAAAESGSTVALDDFGAAELGAADRTA